MLRAGNELPTVLLFGFIPCSAAGLFTVNYGEISSLSAGGEIYISSCINLGAVEYVNIVNNSTNISPSMAQIVGKSTSYSIGARLHCFGTVSKGALNTSQAAYVSNGIVGQIIASYSSGKSALTLLYERELAYKQEAQSLNQSVKNFNIYYSFAEQLYSNGSDVESDEILSAWTINDYIFNKNTRGTAD